MSSKFLILMFTLAVVSLANAVTVSIVSGGLSAIYANAGDTVYVDVVCDTTVAVNFTANVKEETTSAAGHSTATVGTLNSKFDCLNYPGVAPNCRVQMVDGSDLYILVRLIQGEICDGSSSIAAGEKLYQNMAVTLPASAAVGDMFTIDFAIGMPVGGPPPYNLLIDSAVPAKNTLLITIVPEPMTIALVGLGSLALLRKCRVN